MPVSQEVRKVFEERYARAKAYTGDKEYLDNFKNRSLPINKIVGVTLRGHLTPAVLKGYIVPDYSTESRIAASDGAEQAYFFTGRPCHNYPMNITFSSIEKNFFTTLPADLPPNPDYFTHDNPNQMSWNHMGVFNTRFSLALVVLEAEYSRDNILKKYSLPETPRECYVVPPSYVVSDAMIVGSVSEITSELLKSAVRYNCYSQQVLTRKINELTSIYQETLKTTRKLPEITKAILDLEKLVEEDDKLKEANHCELSNKKIPRARRSTKKVGAKATPRDIVLL